jgi:hypothetical protein
MPNDRDDLNRLMRESFALARHAMREENLRDSYAGPASEYNPQILTQLAVAFFLAQTIWKRPGPQAVEQTSASS